MIDPQFANTHFSDTVMAQAIESVARPECLRPLRLRDSEADRILATLRAAARKLRQIAKDAK